MLWLNAAHQKKINALQKSRNGYKIYKDANAIAIISKTKNKFLNTSDGLNELSHVKYLLVGWGTAWRWAATTWSKYCSCFSSRVRLPLYAWMRATPLCAVSFTISAHAQLTSFLYNFCLSGRLMRLRQEWFCFFLSVCFNQIKKAHWPSRNVIF